MAGVSYGADLDDRQRMEVAKVTGAAERLINGLHWPVDEQTIAEMHTVSRDPVVFGVALGNLLGQMELQPTWKHLEQLAALYQQCGADPEVAERQRRWRVSRLWTT